MFLPSEKEFTFFTPWWRCGLYFELTVSTGAEPVAVGELELFDTSYPLTVEAGATTSDMRLNRILPMCLRTLEMCMHETFVDCPFYEQLMYIGDSRLEALLVMAVSHDYRMVEKMLRMFAASDGDIWTVHPCYCEKCRAAFTRKTGLAAPTPDTNVPGEPKASGDWISGDLTFGVDSCRTEARFISTRGKPRDMMQWCFCFTHSGWTSLD